MPCDVIFQFDFYKVSVLRTYTVEELQTMTKALENGDNYVWEIGKNREGPVTIVYLLGYMKRMRNIHSCKV